MGFDGAAFNGPDNAADEVIRILGRVADAVSDEAYMTRFADGGSVYDINGNRIGSWEVIDGD
jgi:hypothetical protein